MIRAFKLEWLKLKNYRVFWVLFSIYLLAQLAITNGGIFLLQWLESIEIDFQGIDPSIIPIYDFPDIWQNTTWLASFAKILIGFIVIISVNNDLTYNTLRQNIIDGVSKKEFILSKFTFIIFLSSVCTLTLIISGLITGVLYSSVTDLAYIFEEWEFILAYFVQLLSYSAFAFLVAIYIKKAGFAIVSLALYTVFAEPMITTILEYSPISPYTIDYVKFFPLYSINSLIDVPYQRYILMEIQTDVIWYEWLIVTGWVFIFTWIVSSHLKNKDLKV